jgi:hypothetical protein
MTNRKARIIAPAIAAGALLADSLALAAPAFAAPAPHAAPHNDCRSWSEELHTYRLGTQYRVAAECTSINPADKARGVLDVERHPGCLRGRRIPALCAPMMSAACSRGV